MRRANVENRPCRLAVRHNAMVANNRMVRGTMKPPHDSTIRRLSRRPPTATPAALVATVLALALLPVSYGTLGPACADDADDVGAAGIAVHRVGLPQGSSGSTIIRQVVLGGTLTNGDGPGGAFFAPTPAESPVAEFASEVPPLSASLAPGISTAQVSSSSGGLQIVIQAGPALQANPAALAAFQRAAALWTVRIADPITVTINANLVNLGSGDILGQASSVVLETGYEELRDALVADAADELDDAVVAALPSPEQFTAWIPTGFALSGGGVATKANFKALGFADLDAQFGVSDGTIQFNSQFAFDYDNRDGVDPNKIDFETVAAHEIGHALGFISQVDLVDLWVENKVSGEFSPSALDFFRFGNDTADDPTTLAEFSTASRWLTPGGDAITDQVLAPWGELALSEIRMATGYYNGDGRQASHWKDNLGLGIMDPTLWYQEVSVPSEADFRALDLLGYEITPVGEPSVALLALSALAVIRLARRRRVPRCPTSGRE
mgnify:CR=1 FL=1